MLELAVVPETMKFNIRKDAGAESRFVRLLELHKTCTEMVKITDPSDLLLDHNCKLQGRFDLTTTAMSQLCSRAVPYLSQVIYDVSGLRKRNGGIASQRSHDCAMAIRWVNDAVKLRFDAITGCTLVVDHRKKRVEGIVGRKYAFLSNMELYRQASRFVTSEFGRKTQFCEAALSGRRMFVRFRGEKLFSVPAPRKPEPFFGGFHFANSEVGECSVRACAVIIRQWCDNKAISPFCEGGKLPHYRGPQFKKRFRDLLGRVRMRAEESTKLRSNVRQLVKTLLGLGGDKATHDKRFDKLKSRLDRKGIRAQLADKALKRAMHYGSYREQVLAKGESPMAVYGRRTAYDLFNAMTYEAKRYSPGERENAEQLAYKMLLGNFNWK